MIFSVLKNYNWYQAELYELILIIIQVAILRYKRGYELNIEYIILDFLYLLLKLNTEIAAFNIIIIVIKTDYNHWQIL